MLKLLLMLFAAAAGAAGSTAWLLSDSKTLQTRAASLSPVFGDRWQELKTALDASLAEGKLAGAETESRLRSQLNAYRRPPAAR